MDSRKERWYEMGREAFLAGETALSCHYIDQRHEPRTQPSQTAQEVANDARRQLAINHWNAGWMDAMWEVLRTANVRPGGPGTIPETAERWRYTLGKVVNPGARPQTNDDTPMMQEAHAKVRAHKSGRRIDVG